MNSWVLGLVIKFALKEIGRLGHGINWSKFESDINAYLDNMIPNKILDEIIVKIVDEIVLALQYIFSQTTVLQNVIEMIAKQDYHAAEEALKNLLEQYFANLPNSEKSLVKPMMPHV
jgi:DNA-binding GntR family transcriptional regulator